VQTAPESLPRCPDTIPIRRAGSTGLTGLLTACGVNSKANLSESVAVEKLVGDRDVKSVASRIAIPNVGAMTLTDWRRRGALRERRRWEEGSILFAR